MIFELPQRLAEGRGVTEVATGQNDPVRRVPSALFQHLNGLAFGEPTGSKAPSEASYVPMVVHFGLVLIAGIYLPATLVAWFRNVAEILG